MKLKFQNFIKKHSLLKKNESVLLGISGGIDSIAMLDLFSKSDYRIGIAHCNFNLRNEDSVKDLEFVKTIANELNIPFFSISFQTQEYAKSNKISIEMAARELRYDWFEKIRKENNFNKIAIAHNMNDQIETFFLNITRRTGLKGICGMKPRNRKTIRPLLFATRTEIENYVKRNKLNWREDSTNNLDIYKRNTIRHNIIPVFQKIENEFISLMNDNIIKFNEAYEIFEKRIKRKRKKCVIRDNEVIEFSITEIKKLKPLRTYLFEFFKPFHFNEKQIDDLIKILNSQSGKQIFSNSHVLLKDRNSIIVKPITELNQTKYIITDLSDIRTPINLTFNKELNDNIYSKKSNEASFDYQKITFPLILRKWQNGDVFVPLGMNGKRKKVSDFLTDLKLTNFQKEDTWVLCSENQIIWVVGQRISENFKLQKESEYKLTVRYSI